MNPAIYFSPDGYALNGPKLMGRQAAGNGFLRAAVKARGEQPLFAYTLDRKGYDAFVEMVGDLDPAAQTDWVPANRLDLVAARGLIYRPDQVLGPAAKLRLRQGIDAYSICGLTHTIASQAAMNATADLLTAPMAPWDAVVCTSSVAVQSLRTMLDAQHDYLAWRFAQPVSPPLPQLPVIPLGVHCDDFACTPQERAAARQALGLEVDEVVALFAGRLTFNGKAHPHAMYAALEQAAKDTGRRVVLIQAGQFANPNLEQLFHTAVAQFCPSVRAVFVDGKDTDLYRATWRASDVFVSLSDNIQETFGLTPVEAMAAGLPVLVSDWNGYKDTIRDGMDGFRIRTWSPAAPIGFTMSRDYEAEVSSYDVYLSQTSTTLSLDWRQLIERTTLLVADAGVRQTMGAAAQARAREVFDWSVVYGQYRELWAELATIRTKARDDAEQMAWLAAAPTVAASNLDPFKVFASYPTAEISGQTLVVRAPNASPELYSFLISHPMNGYWAKPAKQVENLLAALGEDGKTVAALAEQARAPTTAVIELLARIAKLGIVEFRAPEGSI